jgi:hypothetical protein
MSKEFRVSLSGESEKLFQELNGLGFSDQDILSRAFWYLKQVHKTGRVALVTEGALVEREAEAYVEVLYSVVEPEPHDTIRDKILSEGKGLFTYTRYPARRRRSRPPVSEAGQADPHVSEAEQADPEGEGSA